jgi:hypothetical protein
VLHCAYANSRPCSPFRRLFASSRSTFWPARPVAWPNTSRAYKRIVDAIRMRLERDLWGSTAMPPLLHREPRVFSANKEAALSSAHQLKISITRNARCVLTHRSSQSVRGTESDQPASLGPNGACRCQQPPPYLPAAEPNGDSSAAQVQLPTRSRPHARRRPISRRRAV